MAIIITMTINIWILILIMIALTAKIITEISQQQKAIMIVAMLRLRLDHESDYEE